MTDLSPNTAPLISTARPMGVPGYDSLYGWGLLDAGAATLSG